MVSVPGGKYFLLFKIYLYVRVCILVYLYTYTSVRVSCVCVYIGLYFDQSGLRRRDGGDGGDWYGDTAEDFQSAGRVHSDGSRLRP